MRSVFFTHRGNPKNYVANFIIVLFAPLRSLADSTQDNDVNTKYQEKIEVFTKLCFLPFVFIEGHFHREPKTAQER